MNKKELIELASVIIKAENRYELKKTIKSLTDKAEVVLLGVNFPTDEDVDKLPEGELTKFALNLYAEFVDKADKSE